MRRAVAMILLLATSAWAKPAVLQSTALGHGPTVVMIHTVGSTRTAWMPTARKLLPNYRVVLVDLPGHGDSPMPDPFTIDAGAALIDEVLAAQKADSTVVVGQGTGAVLALKALSVHPERARGLIAVEVALRNQIAIPEQNRQRYYDFLDQNFDLMLKNLFMGLAKDSAQRVAIHAQAAQVPPANMKAYLHEMVMFDPARVAKPIKTPILFVGTERIWPADKDSTYFVNTMGYTPMQTFSVRRIGNAGFLVASEQPDSLAAIISGFAQRVLAR